MICASRRWRPAARRRRSLRPNRKAAALLLVLVLLGGMAYFTVSVLHLITQLAVNSACDLMQLKINAAVTAATAQVQGDYYTYRTDADGTITAVSIDTEHVGQVSSLVLEHMMDGDDGQGGGRDEERAERAGEHGLHGFPVRMETVVERCAWLNEV